MNDLKTDVDLHKDMLKQSEGKRGELQVHIEKTTIILKSDTEEHSSY